MFTGLVEDVGEVVRVNENGAGLDITIWSLTVLDDLKVDHSNALDGCCQTVIGRTEETFTVTAVEETLKKTTLGSFRAERRVNVERALRVGDRLGGHFLLGHIDCVGTIVGREELETSRLLKIEYPEEFSSLVIPVGSIAVNGISLTTAEVDQNTCTVSLIPHTLAVTTANNLEVGAKVNLEFDMIGKYVRNMVK